MRTFHVEVLYSIGWHQASRSYKTKRAAKQRLFKIKDGRVEQTTRLVQQDTTILMIK